MPSSIREVEVPNGENERPKGGSQAPEGRFAPFSGRLREAAGRVGHSQAALAKSLGMTSGTFSRYWNGERLPPADTLIDLAEKLGVSPAWLIRGASSGTNPLVQADDAEWIEVPEYDLREMSDDSLGVAISTTPIRKDWLFRTLRQSSGIWLARLPADLPRLDLLEGDLVFLRRVEPGEAQDGAIYIIRLWGHLTVARIDAMLGNRMNSVESNLQDRALAPRDVGTDDGKAILVARVLGAPLRRL